MVGAVDAAGTPGSSIGGKPGTSIVSSVGDSSGRTVVVRVDVRVVVRVVVRVDGRLEVLDFRELLLPELLELHSLKYFETNADGNEFNTDCGAHPLGL